MSIYDMVFIGPPLPGLLQGHPQVDQGVFETSNHPKAQHESVQFKVSASHEKSPTESDIKHGTAPQQQYQALYLLKPKASTYNNTKHGITHLRFLYNDLLS